MDSCLAASEDDDARSEEGDGGNNSEGSAGPETSSEDNSSTSVAGDDVHHHHQQQLLSLSNGHQPMLPTSLVVATDDDGHSPSSSIGGRLQFFLAGRCVLELAHDTDDDGRPRKWTQMSSKSHYPRPATWTPSAVLTDKHDGGGGGKSPTAQGSSESSPPLPKRNVYRRGSCFPYALLRRGRRRCSPPSHFQSQPPEDEEFSLSQVALRRAARNPLRRFLSRMPGEKAAGPAVSSPHKSFVQKAETLFGIVESLSTRALSSKDFEASGFSPKRPAEESSTLVDVASTDDSGLGKNLPQQHSCEVPASVVESPPKLSTDVEKMDASKCASAPFEGGAHRHRLGVEGMSTPRKRDYGTSSSSSVVCAGMRPSVDPASRGSQKKRRRGAYGRGRTIGEAVRNFVICEILDLGGDPRTKYVPRGVFTEVGLRYKVDATTTYRWWLKYCDALKTGGGQPAAAITDSSHAVNRHDLTTDSTKTAKRTTPRSSGGRHHFTTPSRYASCHQQQQLPPVYNNNNSPKVDAAASSSVAFARMEQPASSSSDHALRDSFASSHSPVSNDSQSSSASIVDPASLYASFVHASAFPAPMPPPPPATAAAAGGGHVPIRLCFPYLWSLPPPPTTSFRSNGLRTSLSSSPFHDKDDCDSADEPLDLSVPKKNCQGGDGDRNGWSEEAENLSLAADHRSASNHPGLRRFSSPNTYSEWKPDLFILKTLLRSSSDDHNSRCSAVAAASVSSSRREQLKIVSTPKKNKVPSGHSTSSSSLPSSAPVSRLRASTTGMHRNMKPKHYPFLSLQIGTFEIRSNVTGLGDMPNKFKVIFTKRKFVYEFETTDRLDGGGTASSSRQMACIVVPFSIVEAFWCCDASIVLQVVAKPFMFVGQRHRQVGCVPSLTVYETKKSVDLTGGQLGIAHLHKVTLLKPHLVERLKICLVLFDVRFRDLMAPPTLMHNLATGERGDMDE